MLKSHVRLRLETNAGTEDVGQGSALLSKSVDNGSARRRQRSLEHVAKNTEDAVEVLVALGRSGILPLNTRHHLSNDDKVNDEGRSKKRVLADVEQAGKLLVTRF